MGQAIEIIFKQGVLTAQKFVGSTSSKEETEETWLHLLEAFHLKKLEQEIALLQSKELSEEDFARLQALKEEYFASIKIYGETREDEDS